ncbi:MAG: hypothetical protein E6G76_28250 [Alphaproteobacteria bacterium]|nr:MAG: hypothetical protein E6G76_28250 [Alphaproteobacteria bacterium]
MKSCTGRDDRRMRRLIRAFVTKIPFLGRYRLLRASDIARLQGHNRLLTEAATESARKLQEHNRLLTEAATESARKLQENEAKSAEFAKESGLRFQELQEHNRLLTAAATESARKLQEREGELTNAIDVISRRLMRLTEHNQWLTETMMDGADSTDHAPLIRAVVRRLQEIEEGIPKLTTGQTVPANDRSQVNGVRLQRPAPLSIEMDYVAATRPNLQRCGPRARYLPSKNRVLMVAPGLTRGGAERQILATAHGLLRRDYEVEIFYFADPVTTPDFLDEFSQLGIKCRHPFEYGDSAGGGNNIEDIHHLQQFVQLVDQLDVIALGRALARIIREFRPEIVHCWSDFANVVGGLVATNVGVPTVVLGQRNVPAFRSVEGVAPYLCLDAYRLLVQNSNVVMLNNPNTQQQD